MRLRFALLLLCLTASRIVRADAAAYTLAYDGGKVMHVRAELTVNDDGKLLIGQFGGIDHLPNQWATFVTNLRVENGTVELLGKEGWRTDARGRVVLRYDVDLSYAEGSWPAGNEQAGRKFPRALFTVTKPLFVYSSASDSAEVTFDVPEKWLIAAPWRALSPRRFAVKKMTSLTENSLVLGEFPMRTVRVGAFNMTIATPSEKAIPPELERLVAQTGAMAARLFPDTPPDEYVMTFFRESSEDGEAFDSSAAFTSPESFDRSSLMVTGHTVVHELFHYWIGHKIHAADRERLAFFTEGFTDYYATRVMFASGVLTRSEVDARVGNRLTGYEYFFASPLFEGVSLAAAGKRKGSYRLGVYDGGWMLALALDVRIRQATNGAASLDDVMRKLFATHGLTDTPVAEQDIVAAASVVRGENAEPFFAKYVDAREALPTTDLLRTLGWRVIGQPYAAEMYVIDAEPNNALRRAIFSGPRTSSRPRTSPRR
jgi:predicted metalloprotease with PDZ domain